MNHGRKIILGSSSPFRKELLHRLHIPFATDTPDIDETPINNEKPAALVLRLGEAKARAIAPRHTDAIIIAGDQAAVCRDKILGKPHTRANAISQLQWMSGQRIDFLTSLCVFDARDGRLQNEIVPYSVVFRPLNLTMIENYLDKEPAYNCAGSFKSEGFGIVLCEKFDGEDPTALIGLPLIKLTTMLKNLGVALI